MKALLNITISAICLTTVYLVGFYCGAAKEYSALLSIHNYQRLWEYINIVPSLKTTDDPQIKRKIAEGIDASVIGVRQNSSPYSIKLLKFHLFNKHWTEKWKHNSIASANDTFSTVTDLPISSESQQFLNQYHHENP